MRRFTLFFIFNLLIVAIASAQFISPDTIKPMPKDTVSPAPKKDTVLVKAAPSKDTAKKKDDIKPYNEIITKDAISKKGLFTVHKVDDKWYFEIADSIFNRDILVVTRFSRVAGGAGVYGGEVANQQMVQFEKGPNKNIFLKLIATIAVADSTTHIYQAVELSNANPLVAAFPVKAYGKNSTVIDVTSFFNGDNVPVSLSAGMKRRVNLTGIVSDRSYIKNINAYPINVEVKTVKTFNSNARSFTPSAPQTGSYFDVASAAGVVTLELNNSFLLLPKTPAKRRLFDPRVGYFADNYTRFSDDQQRVRDETFIVRWKLEPKPQDMLRWKRGELVEPQKPIVFYIDPATPPKWVPYLMKGVDDWQKAFEKAGFKNAIYAKEWPKDDTTMSLEDARFSVIRYFASNIENAYGPNVHDPRSGEILESHIGWYHNVMKLLHNWYFIQASPNDKRAQNMVFEDELMGELIRFVSSHEVGHTLGLRHNLGSSSTVPVEKLRDKKWVEANGHTPSIMDYARFNYVAQPGDKISPKGLFPRIGEYDEWAIQWGYSYSGANTIEEDKKITNKGVIDNLKKNPRLWFGTETNPYDPRSQSESLGDDNMLASEYGIKNLQVIFNNIKDWTKEEADYYRNLSELSDQVYVQYNRYIFHVMKNIGGVEETPKSLEQDGVVYQPTAKVQQKRAVDFLNRQLFDTPTWLLNNDILDKVNNPVSNNRVSTIQTNALSSLLSADRLYRVALNESRYPGKNPYTLIELMDDLDAGIWKELNNRGTIDFYKRNLQKQYLSSLIGLLSNTGTSNTDLPSLAKGRLTDLKRKIDNNATGFSDTMTRYHLLDLSDRIKQALEPNK